MGLNYATIKVRIYNLLGGDIMSLERGGKADKDGNRYEYEWVLYNVLSVINNDIQSFIWEPIGPDADGVDIIVITNHNDYQQCKASNGDRDYWRLIKYWIVGKVVFLKMSKTR